MILASVFIVAPANLRGDGVFRTLRRKALGPGIRRDDG